MICKETNKFIMPNLKPVIFNILILFLVLSCSNNDSEIIVEQPLEYFEELNVSYGNDSDQRFDIYLPANRTLDTKVMILVHGGGWSAGDKTDMNLFKGLILQELPDIGIVNMNYRLAETNNNPFPMQINDITAVIEYLKSNRNTFVIDDDFGFIGTSAGAHLSMLWTYAFDTDINIRMVSSIVGPTNFTDPAYLNSSEFQNLFSGFGINLTTDFLEEISPYHQVDTSAPPTILFYGGQDPLIPTSQGIDMRDKLVELGVTHEFTLYENEGHGWSGANGIDTWNKLKIFIQTHLE
jgi:acetyl esterase/lipase